MPCEPSIAALLVRSARTGLYLLTFGVLCFAALVRRAPAQALDRGPYLQRATPSGITVCWRTSAPADSVVRIGATPATLSLAVSDPTPVTEHRVIVSGLSADTRYYYSIGDSSGALAGGDAEHHFATHPLTGTRKPFRAWVIGDSGSATAPQRAVRDSFLAFNGMRDLDLWLMLGDNAYSSGTQAEYQAGLFQNMYEPILSHTTLWPTLGNHDAVSANPVTQTGPYFDIFELPVAGEAGGVPSGTEAYYSYDYANTHFVCLDSSGSPVAPGSPMLSWLQADLAATQQEWVIAYWHHPPYSKGSHDSDTEGTLIAMRQVVVPVLEAYGVDLVLCGHSHDYERSMLIDGHYGLSTTFGPANVVDGGSGSIAISGAYRKSGPFRAAHQGTVYAVVGCSGQLVTTSPLNHPVMLANEHVYGSAVLDVNGDQLDLTFIDIGGMIRDTWTLVKNRVTPVDRTHVVLPPFSTWRYDDSGADLGTAWTAPGFNDSAWASGQAVLGFGDPFIVTPISAGPLPSAVNPTTYFRQTFSLPLPAASFERVQLFVNYDDGFVAWLNGVEVARSPSMPTGPVGFGTLAASHEGGSYEVFDLTPFRAQLAASGNVLAVEVHQTSATSSDLAFDLAIRGEAFLPFLASCAAGTVMDPQGHLVDLLHLDGSGGGAARSVDARTVGPLSIAIDAPPGFASAPFALFAAAGTPPASAAVTFPGVGSFCFLPAVLAPTQPGLLYVATSLGPDPNAVLQASPAPWSVSLPGGVPVGFEVTLQAAMIAGSQILLTNAVRLNVIP